MHYSNMEDEVVPINAEGLLLGVLEKALVQHPTLGVVHYGHLEYLRARVDCGNTDKSIASTVCWCITTSTLTVSCYITVDSTAVGIDVTVLPLRGHITIRQDSVSNQTP